MYILLPSSEAKAIGGTSMQPLQDELTPFRNILSNELLHSKATNLSKNPNNAEFIHKLNSEISSSDQLMPIWQRYQGVVYRNLNLTINDPLDLIYLCSPYLGIAAANTNIPNYKLSFNSNIGDIGKLSNFWAKNLSSHKILSKEGVFLDLLNNSQRLILPYPLGSTVYQVDFLSNDRKLIGHFGKAIKGKFLRDFLSYDLSLSMLDTLTSLSNAKLTIKRF
jgi:cytoplasmic iron level regulating protein YaaA (DUF328/UPF0246 family)